MLRVSKEDMENMSEKLLLDMFDNAAKRADNDKATLKQLRHDIYVTIQSRRQLRSMLT